MRDRPFIAAGEQPRPYSEIIAERNQSDPRVREKRRALDDIAALEGEAADATDPAGRKRLQCEAEALRSALAEQGGPT